MSKKRMKICVAAGAVLGVFCIVGASVRSGFEKDAVYLFSMWYNRLLMGATIGLAGQNQALPKALLQGAMLGFLVSFGFYSATGFDDAVGFLAGIAYGAIIEYIAFRYSE